MGDAYDRVRKERADRDADDSATRTAGKKPSEDVAGKDAPEGKGEGGKEADKKEKPEKKGESGDAKGSEKEKPDDGKEKGKDGDGEKGDGDGKGKPKGEKDYSKPPQNIAKSLKDAWDKLPAEVQKEMTEHHAEVQSRDRDFGRKVKDVERIAAEAAPVKEMMDAIREKYPGLKDVDAEGLAQGFGALVDLSAKLEQAPEKTILEMAGKIPGFLQELKKTLADVPDEKIAEFQAKLSGDAEGARIAALEAENKALREGAEKKSQEGLTDDAELDRLKTELRGHLSDFGSTAPHWDVLEAETRKHLADVVNDNPRDAEWPDLIVQAYNRAHVRLFPGQDLPKFAGSPSEDGKADAADAANSLNVTNQPGDSPSSQSEEDAMGAIWEKHRGNRR